MKKGTIWITLTCLMVTSMVLASCNKTTTTMTSTSTTTNTTTTTKTFTTTTQVATTTTTTTTAGTGNWWDSIGKPQYGGDMIIRSAVNVPNFDPYSISGNPTIMGVWLENLFQDDWTIKPTVFAYNIDWRPPDYVIGRLAASYEFTDQSTFVVHLRPGIQWQNIAPINGREFTSADVVYHFNREYGLGGGFSKPSPYNPGTGITTNLISATATDKYTVVFKWKVANPEFIMESIQASGQYFEAPEVVTQWGDLNDWHHAIGTGPFTLQDYVSDSSATLVKNLNYWAYDERYPQNRLPYVNQLKILIIPDKATALAAMRTGKLDFADQITNTEVQSIQKANPEILQFSLPGASAETIEIRNDKAPFTDIRVRQAMQMAVDLSTIAKNYYNGTVNPNPCALTASVMTGWGFPYDQWPQDLKDQYAYNPTQAKALLTAAGYTTGFNTDIVVDAAGDLDLIQIVKAYFSAVGINMEIRTMESTAWSAFVRTGRKHDQLVNKVGGNSLGLSYEPSMQIKRFTTGNSSNYSMVSDPVIDGFYTKYLASTSIDAVKQILSDTNVYVARQHFVISLLQPVQFALCQPWLKGYDGEARAIGAFSPFFLGFYASRFWIDTTLKISMGH